MEYDSPSVLTANPKSKFKMMLDAVESQQGQYVLILHNCLLIIKKNRIPECRETCLKRIPYTTGR